MEYKNDKKVEWLIMKRVIIFIVSMLCLLCCNAACFAALETEYHEKDNLLFHQYKQEVRLGYDGKTNLSADFSYSQLYGFNENFDPITKKCRHNDIVSIIFHDYADLLRYLKDVLVLTDLETGKTVTVPIKFQRKKSHDKTHDVLSYCIFPNDNMTLTDMLLSEKPFRISFNFVVAPVKGLAEKMIFEFNKNELNELKSAIEYDLYSDTSQKENVNKAMRALSK